VPDDRALEQVLAGLVGMAVGALVVRLRHALAEQADEQSRRLSAAFGLRPSVGVGYQRFLFLAIGSLLASAGLAVFVRGAVGVVWQYLAR
jgi:hypothetical protein